MRRSQSFSAPFFTQLLSIVSTTSTVTIVLNALDAADEAGDAGKCADCYGEVSCLYSAIWHCSSL